ncbi:MAG: MFS transporter [Pseudomonadota bacterium]
MNLISAIRAASPAVLGFVALGLMWGSISALLPQFKAHLGVSDALFGVLLTAGSAGLLVTMWLAAPLDRLLRERSITASGILVVLAALLTAIAPTPLWFFLCLLGLGFGSGLLDVLTNARLAERELKLSRPLMNASHGIYSLAYVLGAIATGILRDIALAPILILTVIGMAVVPIALAARTQWTPPETAQTGRGPLPTRGIVILGLIVLIAFGLETITEAWSALHIERSLGGRPVEGALGPAFLGLSMAVGRFGGHLLAHRVPESGLMIGGAAMSALGLLLAAGAVSPGPAYMGFGLVGLGVSVLAPLALGLVGRIAPPDRRTDAVARVSAIGFAAYVLTPTLMGTLSEGFGLPAALGLVALIAVPIPALVWGLRQSKTRPNPR